MMKKILIIILLFNAKHVNAGISGSDSLLSNLKLSAYFESYYTHDFGEEEERKIRGMVNHSKNNEIAINLGLIRANYQTDKFRANLGLMLGSYTDANYAGADYGYKYIYESTVGIRIAKKHNLWFDVGIFPSHLGIESVIGAENYTLTRSLQAEASPYYESGARISYTSKNEKLYASVMALNGWQVIAKQNNYALSLGTQIQYRPNSRILINSSAYLGNNNSYSSTYIRPRYFHNFYTQIQWHPKFSTQLGLDIGAEEIWNRANYYYNWYSPIFIARYSPNSAHSFAFRAEYFVDQYQLVFRTNSLFGFEGTGLSLNYDLRLLQFALFRIEGKMYSANNPVFIDNAGSGKTNTSISSALIFHLND
jgi:Putative beta-barrel porin-2, OmpL-like. bbp2